MKRLAGLAALLALGAGLGTYFATRDESPPRGDQAGTGFNRSHTPEARIMFIPQAGP
ncbi:MAG: hypothetical protein H0W87_01400 [Actinobacteria bacterium]|nr:hypothetical protein [Actinomycetota bacterium]